MTSNFRRWAALVVVCLGQLMIVLDTTIVNVALLYMQRDLGFSQSSLTWVVNAYLIAYGGFLLVAGRLGDFRSVSHVATSLSEFLNTRRSGIGWLWTVRIREDHIGSLSDTGGHGTDWVRDREAHGPRREASDAPSEFS